MNTEHRYYTVEGDTALIYDAPYIDQSQSVSVVPKSDLAWYRAHFLLRKIWGESYKENNNE